jgi:hypothetical protein
MTGSDTASPMPIGHESGFLVGSRTLWLLANTNDSRLRIQQIAPQDLGAGAPVDVPNPASSLTLAAADADRLWVITTDPQSAGGYVVTELKAAGR